MKLRSTTPASISSAKPFGKRAFAVVAVIIMAVAVPIQFFSQAYAIDYDARIRALEQDISRYDAEAGKLAQQANTLQNEVNRLNNEKAVIQAQIDINTAKAKKLAEEIAANEKKIQENQDALGIILADLHVDDAVTPVEMLASSNNIGDFLDKQETRAATRDQLTEKIEEIKRLKAELEQQKIAVDNVLRDQEAQRNALAAKEAEQQKLLNDTRGSEDAYRNLSAQSTAQKEELQRQQQRAIEAALAAAGGGGGAVAGDPNKGGYPSNLANSDYYNPVVDPWGMYSRQCVSYTAWKVYQKNGYMPYWGGRGNANQWPANARAAGIPTSSVPRAGSVGVMMAGAYGHVVWVESVNSNGTINVSQYNYWNAGGSGWGHYSEMYNVSPAAYDVYIYF